MEIKNKVYIKSLIYILFVEYDVRRDGNRRSDNFKVGNTAIESLMTGWWGHQLLAHPADIKWNLKWILHIKMGLMTSFCVYYILWLLKVIQKVTKLTRIRVRKLKRDVLFVTELVTGPEK